MASKLTPSCTSGIKSCSDALIDFSSLTEKMAKTVPSELAKLANYVKSLPEQDKDEMTSTAEGATKVAEGIKKTFCLAQSYIRECYKLAEYICREEEATIVAVRRGKVCKFKEYMTKLLSMSCSCQRELKSLINYIQTTEKPLLDEQQKAIEAKKTSTQRRAGFGGAGAIAGGGAITAGLSAAGGATVVTFATSVGPQAPFTLPIGLTIAAGTFLFTAAGTALLGTAVGSTALIWHYTKKKEAYEKIIDKMKEMKAQLESIEKAIDVVREQLELTIENNGLKEMTNRTFKAHISGSTERSIIETIETVTFQSRQLKEHCQSLRNARDLQEFTESHKKQH